MALEILKRILQVEHTCHFPNLNPISGFIPKILRFYVILAFIAGRQESGTFLNSNATTLHSPCSDPCLLTFLFFDLFLAKIFSGLFQKRKKAQKWFCRGLLVGFRRNIGLCHSSLHFSLSKKRSPEMSESDAKNLFHLWYCIKIERPKLLIWKQKSGERMQYFCRNKDQSHSFHTRLLRGLICFSIFSL